MSVLLFDMNAGANLLSRSASKGVDFVLVLAIMEALPRAGWLAGVMYILICDGLSGGQSLGKKLTGLRVIGQDGRPCDIKGSILRNIALGLGLVLMKIPLVGWLLLIAIICLEFITMIGSPGGQRFGDELAGTSVVEAHKPDNGRDESV